jgi:hypothetical protein
MPSTTSSARRSSTHRTTRGFVAAAGAAIVAFTSSAFVAAPANAAPKSQVGLFGSQDPTYDGVYRQALSLIALRTAGVTPDAGAIAWLKSQQCADGTFTSFREEASIPCDSKAEDSNATSMAVQALVALGGQDAALASAAAALPRFQLNDGGFYSNQVFGPPASDANSTGLVLSALAATGTDQATVTKGGHTGVDFLLGLQLGCDADEAARGAFDFMPQTPLAANDYATVQAALGLAGGFLPVTAATPDADVPVYTCPAAGLTAADSANVAAGYVANRLATNGGAIPSSWGAGNDLTSTANAVLALTAVGKGSAQLTAALDTLEASVASYTKDAAGADLPGPLATLILTAKAGGRDPHAFGGSDLVARLIATQTPATPAPPANPTPELPFTGAPVGVLAAFGLLAAGIGAALVATSRRRGDELA